MVKLVKHLVFLTLLLVSALSISQNAALFEEGKSHNKNGNFEAAIKSWSAIIDEGKETSAALYYNLGNAHYKLNHIGPSIYYYKKGLQLSPNDADIRNNLAFAENARLDVIEPLPQSIFNKWYKNIIGIFSYDGWAVFSIVTALGFGVLFLLYFFSSSVARKRAFFASASFIVLIFIGSLVMAFLSYNEALKDRKAIVYAERLPVKSEPSMGGSSAFLLHEGTEVKITAEEGEWVQILLADGQDGWVPTSEVKEL